MMQTRSSKRRRHRAGEQRAGFTILEVVLAMGILVLGLSSLLGLFTFGAALTRQAGLRSVSATAVDSIMADLEASLFPLQSDGTAGEPALFENRDVPGAPGVVYSAKAEPHIDGPLNRAGEPLEYRVDIELAWRTQGVRRTKSFTTLMLREVPFGERMRRRRR
ncbi:MAG: hypothetical protein ACI8QC_002096 [Planctomycetota bacterium]